MNRLIVAVVCLLPGLSGCALFNPDPAVPPPPKVVGVTAQDLALKQQIREGHGDHPDVFVPLAEARAAVEAARAQPKINTYAAGMLAQARAELKKAEQLWTVNPSDGGRTAAELRKVATHAHSAKRLAQIARYTAMREIKLAQLGEASDQLRRLRAETGPSAAGGQLVGKKVVPGPFGAFSFRPGTARLNDNSAPVIARLAELLKQNPKVGVAILGHTSNSEPPAQVLERFVQSNSQLAQRDLSYQQKVYAYNLALSNARARAVARALVNEGIAARRIGARGFGSSRPVASNATAEGRAANERVIAVIIPGPDSENSPLRGTSG